MGVDALMDYTLIHPPDFDVFESEITAKGCFGAAEIVANGRRDDPVFFDWGRPGQEVESGREAGRVAYVEKNLVIVEKITRATIDAAVAELARAGFVALAADDADDSP